MLDPTLRLFACNFSAAKVLGDLRTHVPMGTLVLFAPCEAAAEAFAKKTAEVRYPAAAGYFGHRASAVQVPDIMVLAACAALAPCLCGGKAA